MSVITERVKTSSNCAVITCFGSANHRLLFRLSHLHLSVSEESVTRRLWGVFAAIFRSTPILRITAVDVGGNILLETYCCALNQASVVQLAKGQMYSRLDA